MGKFIADTKVFREHKTPDTGYFKKGQDVLIGNKFPLAGPFKMKKLIKNLDEDVQSFVYAVENG